MLVISMKVLHIVSGYVGKESGGTVRVVDELMRYIDSDVACGGKFIPALKAIFVKKDIVVVHDTTGFWYLLFPKFMRSPAVYVCHGLWKNYFYIYKPHGVQKIKAYIAMKMQGSMIKRADFTIAVAYHVKQEIEDLFNIPSKKIAVVHNGVDTEKFHRTKMKRDRSQAIWVGRDPVRKGLQEAIKYAKNHSLKLFVVGINGKDKNDIKYFFNIDDSKLVSLYNKSSVLLFFSKHEAHPLVPLEAMACGLDIIASKDSNIEIAKQQKDGSYKVKGKTGLKLAKKYDWRNQAKKHLEIYKKTILNSKVNQKS